MSWGFLHAVEARCLEQLGRCIFLMINVIRYVRLAPGTKILGLKDKRWVHAVTQKS